MLNRNQKVFLQTITAGRRDKRTRFYGDWCFQNPDTNASDRDAPKANKYRFLKFLPLFYRYATNDYTRTDIF